MAPHSATGEGGGSLRLEHTWEVAAWENAHVGSCRLGKMWKVANWENAHRKVPNIYAQRKHTLLHMRALCQKNVRFVLLYSPFQHSVNNK